MLKNGRFDEKVRIFVYDFARVGFSLIKKKKKKKKKKNLRGAGAPPGRRNLLTGSRLARFGRVHGSTRRPMQAPMRPARPWVHGRRA